MSDLVVTLEEKLDDWREAWDELVLTAARPSPFLRSWWLEGIAAPAPAFVLVLDRSGLVGGAALARDRFLGVPRLKMLGFAALSPHDLDVVARPGLREEVALRVVAYLDRSANCMVDLSGLAGDGQLAAALPARSRQEIQTVASSIVLPSDFESYLASLSKKLRQDIKRGRRRLEEQGVQCRVVTEDLSCALRQMERLHDLRWHGSTVFGRQYSSFERAVRRGTERGEAIVFYEAIVDERALASNVTFELDGRVVMCQAGRDPDPEWSSTGTFLRAQVIERACQRGMREVDMGPSHRRAKIRWAEQAHDVLRARWGRGALGVTGAGLHAAARPIARRVRRVASTDTED